jgi:hypothetical protein
MPNGESAAFARLRRGERMTKHESRMTKEAQRGNDEHSLLRCFDI